MRVWLLALVLAICWERHLAVAATTCEYIGSYYDHGNWNYCQVENSVPAGCPIHLVVRPGVPAVQATVMRGATTVDVTGATTANPVNHDVFTIDVEACDCPAIAVQAAFEETTVDLVGVQPGDMVDVAGGFRAIGPAGACPAVEWPQTFVEHVACDVCPGPTGDPPNPSHHAGCAATSAPSWLAAVLVVLCVATRRRRRR
jgi:uncharacterized protein (TIGR03382 family)